MQRSSHPIYLLPSYRIGKLSTIWHLPSCKMLTIRTSRLSSNFKQKKMNIYSVPQRRKGNRVISGTNVWLPRRIANANSMSVIASRHRSSKSPSQCKRSWIDVIAQIGRLSAVLDCVYTVSLPDWWTKLEWLRARKTWIITFEIGYWAVASSKHGLGNRNCAIERHIGRPWFWPFLVAAACWLSSCRHRCTKWSHRYWFDHHVLVSIWDPHIMVAN